MTEWLSLHLFIHVENLEGSTAYFLELSEFTKTAGYDVNMKKSTGVYENGENCKTEKLTISPQSKIFKYKSKKNKEKNKIILFLMQASFLASTSFLFVFLLVF